MAEKEVIAESGMWEGQRENTKLVSQKGKEMRHCGACVRISPTEAGPRA